MLLHGCVLGERSSGGISKFRTTSFKCYVDHSCTMYSSGNIDVRNWIHLFESRCIILQCIHRSVTVLQCSTNACVYRVPHMLKVIRAVFEPFTHMHVQTNRQRLIMNTRTYTHVNTFRAAIRQVKHFSSGL